MAQAGVEGYLLEKTRRVFTSLRLPGINGGAESSHPMRAASWELRAALRLLADLFPETELKQARRQLRRITQHLDEMRSLDLYVHLLRRAARRMPASTLLAHTTLTQNLLVERGVCQAALHELMRTLAVGKLQERVERLIRSLPDSLDERRLLRSTSQELLRLRRAVRRRHRQYQQDRTTVSFHKFRTAARRYHYGTQAARGVYRAGDARRIKAVEELYDYMDRCHDLEQLIRYLKKVGERWRGRNKSLALAAGKLIQCVEQEHEAVLARFHNWIEEDRLWYRKIKLRTHDE